jgi:hypothetical protein
VARAALAKGKAPGDIGDLLNMGQAEAEALIRDLTRPPGPATPPHRTHHAAPPGRPQDQDARSRDRSSGIPGGSPSTSFAPTPPKRTMTPPPNRPLPRPKNPPAASGGPFAPCHSSRSSALPSKLWAEKPGLYRDFRLQWKSSSACTHAAGPPTEESM